jgi:16S rRNA G1207 methylase RsmC
MADHYFSEAPAGEAQLRTLTVRLGGRDVEVDTAGGVFSPGHVDTGTRVLLQPVPDPAPGALLDLGCGWGPIALDAALRAREARVPLQVWAVDVNERARELTARNAAALGLTDVRTVAPEDVPADVRFSAIWSNPPIRVGKAVLHGMLSAWLPRLEPGGAAHLVVAKKLGADSLREWLDREFGADCDVERTATAKGFRILRVTRRP